MQAAQGEKSPLLPARKKPQLTISDDDLYKQKGRRKSSDIPLICEARSPSLTGPRLGIVVCVLLVEMCERMAYYGVVANLVLYCTSVLELSSNTATTVSLIFSGTVYLIPILGGYLADAWSNRFNVIFGSALIYICGLCSLLCSAIDFSEMLGKEDLELETEERRIFYLLGLCLVAIGTGGIKANVGPFGAQQVQDLGADALQTYFNWFYWSINVGGLVANTLIAFVQQNVSFAWGFLIPVACMCVAMLLLNLARSYYIFKDGNGSVLGQVLGVCGEGLCRQSPYIDGKRQVFDSARREFGGGYESHIVDGVIAVLRMVPVMLFVVMFWAIYSQMQSTYFLQGERMDLSVGGLMVPVAFLNAFNTVAVLITIPVLDRVVYPCFRRYGRPLTYLQRIGIGFVLSASSVAVAGWLEVERKEQLGFEQKVGEEDFYASRLSVLWQAPQFFLVGTGEAFTSIAGYEFAYTQAPKSLQSAITGVYLATNGLGYYLSTAILAFVTMVTKEDPWFPADINDGHVEYVFFLFAGLMLVVLAAYVPVARWYTYQEYKTDAEEAALYGSHEADNQSVQEEMSNSITII